MYYSLARLGQISVCEECMNQVMYKVTYFPHALTMFHNSEDFSFSFFSSRTMLHAGQVNQGADGGPRDQEPNIVSPIARPEPH